MFLGRENYNCPFPILHSAVRVWIGLFALYVSVYFIGNFVNWVDNMYDLTGVINGTWFSLFRVGKFYVIMLTSGLRFQGNIVGVSVVIFSDIMPIRRVCML
jgi:hypothetical protein